MGGMRNNAKTERFRYGLQQNLLGSGREGRENAIQWMKETYGSPLGYITRELGVTEAEIHELREKFLE